MTKSLIKILAAFYLLALMVSCDRPECKNTNAVFDEHAPHTKEYKGELAKQLKLVDRNKLSYWMGFLKEDNNSRYIHTNIQGDGLCAVIVLTVGKSRDGIEGILKNRGEGYRGAELKDLKFDIVTDRSNTEFIFKSVGSIID